MKPPASFKKSLNRGWSPDIKKQRMVHYLRAAKSMVFITVLFLSLLLSAAPASAQSREVNYDEGKVPRYVLPDPLVFDNGRPVRTKGQWKRRRAEIMESFRSQMFGREPAAPAHLAYEITKTVPDIFDGLATMNEVKLYLDENRKHYCKMLMFVPNGVRGKVPAFLGLNFKGNQSTTLREEVSLPDSVQMHQWGPGFSSEQRGVAARRWPYEFILKHGYAVCTIHYNDCEPDSKDGYGFGIRSIYDRGSRNEESWGAVSAWAWSLSRALDYLEKDSRVDARKVAVIGHSRLGKTALWAGAADPRFALVISNDSGCSGAALSRRVYGESVYVINTAFPHWFCDNYARYNRNEAALPFDQHELIAMIAPRPVYVASASLDRWADPYGEYLSLVGATPVYRLLGYDGFTDTAFPEVEKPSVAGRMGHHVRNGKHDILLYDWQNFISFADRFLK